MLDLESEGPDYLFIERGDAEDACDIHYMEELIHLHFSELWDMQMIGLDKISFTCHVCGSHRVYQLLQDPDQTMIL